MVSVLSEPKKKEEAIPEPASVVEEETVAPTEETVSEETEKEAEPEPEVETAEAETEEVKPEAEEEKEEEGEEEIEVVEEKIYTISLRHAWVVTPRGKRAPRAIRDVRAFVSHNMKAEEVAMSNEINSAIWSRGINKPPRKITVRAVKDKEGKVIVYPAKAA
jgi:large subunit ribosomal protein L31e